MPAHCVVVVLVFDRIQLRSIDSTSAYAFVHRALSQRISTPSLSMGVGPWRRNSKLLPSTFKLAAHWEK